MATNYPGAVDSFVNPTATDTLDSATVPHAAQHDNINDAMSAVQVTLGVNPQGSSATVVARLTALDSTVAGKAPLASPALTGTPTVPTAAVDTNTTQIASTAFVLGQASTTTPVVDGTATIGTATTFARADHKHPTDTTRAAVSGQTFTGAITAPNVTDTALSTAGIVTNTSAGLLGTVATVPVANGGTGQTTLTSGNVLIGNGTSGVTTIGITTTGEADKIVKTTSTGAVVADSVLVGGINDGVISIYNASNSNAQQLKAVSASVASTNYLPITSGSLVSTGDTGTVTDLMIQSISGSKVSGTLLGANGGTGVANTGKTITLGGNLTTSGANATTLTTTGTTSVTLPTSGTLATLAGSETLTNKSISGSTNTLTNIPASAISSVNGSVIVAGVTTITGTTYTVASTDYLLICNNSATLTITLPTASSSTGRVLKLVKYNTSSIVSASSNVGALSAGTAGTTFFTSNSVAGKFCEIISNGTVWQIVANS